MNRTTEQIISQGAVQLDEPGSEEKTKYSGGHSSHRETLPNNCIRVGTISYGNIQTWHAGK